MTGQATGPRPGQDSHIPKMPQRSPPEIGEKEPPSLLCLLSKHLTAGVFCIRDTYLASLYSFAYEGLREQKISTGQGC
jgi:hypothetical protein